jgi:hypothetical protein
MLLPAAVVMGARSCCGRPKGRRSATSAEGFRVGGYPGYVGRGIRPGVWGAGYRRAYWGGGIRPAYWGGVRPGYWAPGSPAPT